MGQPVWGDGKGAQLQGVQCLVAPLCPTLCNPMDCSPPGSSVHLDSPGKNTGVGCHASSRGSSQPRDGTRVSCIAGRFFTIWATRDTLKGKSKIKYMKEEKRTTSDQQDFIDVSIWNKSIGLVLKLKLDGSYRHWVRNPFCLSFFPLCDANSFWIFMRCQTSSGGVRSS